MMLRDAIGQPHRPVQPGEAVRIVSLVPSLTELLVELGLAPQLVGRTGFCIHPREIVREIPKVGGTKDVNLDRLRALAPTHVVVNIDENEKPVVERIAQFVPHVIVTHPMGPQDCPPLYRLLGAVFGAADAAEAMCAAFERELLLLREECAVRPLPPQRVVYCIWKDPWMTVARDTYIARMLELIGWTCWQSTCDARRYPSFEWVQVADAADLVLLSTEPYRFGERHVQALEREIGKAVLLVDGEMLSWYGSRAIAGLRYLRALRTLPGRAVNSCRPGSGAPACG